MLILLFGYGLSLDVKDVPVAVVLEDPSPEATELAAGFQLVAVFRCATADLDAEGAGAQCSRGKVDGIVRIRSDFARRRAWRAPKCRCSSTGPTPTGPGSSRATCRGRSANGWHAAAGRGEARAAGPVVVQDRLWFNEANESRYFLVPGLIVLIMTLIGAMLTALVDGPRVGTRHDRGPVRHTRARRRNPARQDHPLLRPRDDRAGALPAGRPSSSSTCRFAVRLAC